MKLARKTLQVLALFVSLALADDFMGIPIEDRESKDARPLPTILGGAGVSLDYYLRSFDGSVAFDVEYRINKNHSIGFFGTYPFVAEYLEAGFDWHWYFIGSLMTSGHDDFLRFSFSCFYLDHLDENYFSPVVTFGYGRDILFFKKSNFLGRLEFYGNYVLGEPVEKKNERLPIVEPVRFFLHLKFSLLFF